MRIFTEARICPRNPQVVFHLAAFFVNENSVDYPQKDLMVNRLGTLLVHQYATMTRKSSGFIYSLLGVLDLRQ